MDRNEFNRRVNNGESFILANDGQFLGKLCLNIYDPESILNHYGIYGSPYSTYSINNRYSMYGSQYSSLSPFNPHTTTPPTCYLKGMRAEIACHQLQKMKLKVQLEKTRRRKKNTMS